MGFCRGTRPRLLSRRRRRHASAPHFEKPISGRSGEWRSRANRARHSHNRRAVHPWIVAVILAAAGAARDGRGFFFCFLFSGPRERQSTTHRRPPKGRWCPGRLLVFLSFQSLHTALQYGQMGGGWGCCQLPFRAFKLAPRAFARLVQRSAIAAARQFFVRFAFSNLDGRRHA